MRRVVAVLLLCALPASAFAQMKLPTEQVEVDANKTLTGLWKLSFPELTISMSLPFGNTIGLRLIVGETFCRMDQDSDSVSLTCLSGGAFRRGSASLDGKNLHLAWGGALTRLVVDAVPQSASSFSGVFGLKFMGILHPAALPLTGERFNNQADTPDTAGKAPLLTTALTQLAAGGLTAPHDPAFAGNFWNAVPNKPGDVASLGKIEAVIYLGEGKVRRWDQKREIAPFLFSAYQVEFTNGQRLCGIHQRDDGVLDGFLCV